MKIKLFVEHGAENPTKKTDGAAGIDLAAFTDKPILIEPMQRIAVKTGVYVQLPKGYEAQIRTRSGLALKNGITVLNSPGTIDSDYTGEIMVILINLSDRAYVILNGTRIAQMVVAKYEDLTDDKIEVVESKEAFGKTERGNGGFGSTGV